MNSQMIPEIQKDFKDEITRDSKIDVHLGFSENHADVKGFICVQKRHSF